jgi:FixJ family two-component response regulator
VPEAAKVLVVDDDGAVRASLTRLLKSAGLTVEAFESAESLLVESITAAASCIVLDVRLPGLDGPGLQDLLVARGHAVPIVFLSGYASTPLVVRAMKHGATTFLEKPVDGDALLAAVTEAIAASEAARKAAAEMRSIQARLATLTSRELEVVEQVAAGKLNKQIGTLLGISEKTVKVHRARGQLKLGVRSVAQLVRLVEKREGYLNSAAPPPESRAKMSRPLEVKL